MKKKAWWKKAALLCGMMALLPFCMGICLMPTASPEPEVSPGTGERSLPGLHGAGAGFKL